MTDLELAAKGIRTNAEPRTSSESRGMTARDDSSTPVTDGAAPSSPQPNRKATKIPVST